MRYCSPLIALLMLGSLMAACGSDPVSVPVPTPASPIPEAPSEAPDIPVQPSGALPSDPLAAQLVGTTWHFGDIYATFIDGETLWMKGGQIAEIAEEGIQVKYTFKDGGILELQILGETRFGAWNGEILILDGMTGEKAP